MKHLQDVEQTRIWLQIAKPDDFDINVITPYPGSKIYDDAVPSTKHKGYFWEYKGLYFNKPLYNKDNSYYKGKGGQSFVDSRTDELTSERIHELREEIQKCTK